MKRRRETRIVITVSRQSPPGDGREGDGAGADPDDDDEIGRPLVAHLDGVVEGVGDGPVPVQRDDAEVEDGGGGGEDVHRVPEITQQWTEDPALVHSLVRRKIFILNYLSISSDREL